MTVIFRNAGGQPSGEVVGPSSAPDGAAVSMGQDGSLTPHQALATGCHLANQTGHEVVVMDPDGQWQSGWGKLEPA